VEGRERGPNIPLINDRSWYGLSFVGSIQTDFQPTPQPTQCDVLYDFRELWQSPRFAKSL
jgi:hypothetical protein